MKQKYEKRIQSSLDNLLKDQRHEVKFENHMKNKNNFLLSKTLIFLFKQKYIYPLTVFEFQI